MTVQEMIDMLNTCEDKTAQVCAWLDGLPFAYGRYKLEGFHKYEFEDPEEEGSPFVYDFDVTPDDAY